MVNWNDINPEDLEIAERAYKHGIKKEEFEELFQNDPKIRKIKNKGDIRGRYLIIGKVHGKYILAISAPMTDRLKIFSGIETSDELKNFMIRIVSMNIKDIFKYEKIISLEIKLDCEHTIRCYLDFGDGSSTIINKFSVTKKDSSSIFRTDVQHLYLKKKKYIVKLRIDTTCPQETERTDVVYIGFGDLIVIKRAKVSFESINTKVRLIFESINMRKIKEFDAKNEDELLEQVMLWPKVDKEWDKGWKRIESKKHKGIRKNTTIFSINIHDPKILKIDGI